METIPTPRQSFEDYQIELTATQIAIEGINDHILLLQFERQRYEQQGHRIVELMMEAATDGNV